MLEKMKKLMIILFVICTSCSLDEQDTEDPIFCTTDQVAGLEIIVRDAANTDTIITTGITVVAQDGDYIETLVNFPESNLFTGAFERVGTYIITVRANGYETFTSSIPIVVDQDICHVITERREIFLIEE